MTPALALAVVLGVWTGSGVADESRAHVRLDVGGALVQPSVRIDLRGCRSTRTVHLRTSLGLVAGPRFATRTRFSPPHRAAVVRLRFSGRFTSPTTARGTVRGRLRYAGGHVCAIPRLRWIAHPVTAAPTPVADDADEAGEAGDPDDDVIDDDEDLDEDDDIDEDDDGGDDEPEAALP
jgi:hypothetical protein